MSREYYLSHPQDIRDMCDDIKEKTLPLIVVADRAVPEKIHEDEYAKRSRQMSYFHRTICVEYATAAGVNEQEAKYELLLKFGRCEEIIVDENGEYDVVWVENDNMMVFEQGKKYRIQSVANMPNDELARLIQQCKDYLLQYYGVMVTNFNKKYKTK